MEAGRLSDVRRLREAWWVGSASDHPQSVEYAVSNRSSCKGCAGLIEQGELRIGHDQPSSFHDGFDTQWFHVDCFKRRHGTLRLERIRHYETLRWSDQADLSRTLGGVPLADNPELRARSERLWAVKDEIAGALKPKDIKAALEDNHMAVGKASVPWLTHRLADALVYGRIGLCPVCKSDGLAHNSREYVCYGNVSEFTKCDFRGTHSDIVRYRFNVSKNAPKYLKAFAFADDYPKDKFVPPAVADDNDSSDAAGTAKRALSDDEDDEDDGKKPKKGQKKAPAKKAKSAAASAPASVGDTVGPSSVAEASQSVGLETEAPVPDGKEMHGIAVVVAGTKASLGGYTPKALKDLIEAHGGTVETNVGPNVSCMVCGAADLAKPKPLAKIAAARSAGLAILSAEWAVRLCARTHEGLALRTLAGAAAHVLEQPAHADKYRLAQRWRGMTELEGPVNKYRAQPVGGCDLLKLPAAYSGKGTEILVVHDAVYGYTAYNAMLNQADVGTGVNKFYNVAVIKKGAQFDVFCKWGRIGVHDKGGETLKTFKSQDAAIDAFVEKFEKFAAFRWDKRHRYKKQAGAYLWVALDDGIEAASAAAAAVPKKAAALAVAPRAAPSGGTVLDARVRELLELIFDKEMMTQTLVRFKIDLKKQPLGKINPKQIREGYSVLSTIAGLVKAGQASKAQLTDASNRFYTLIPHDFGHSLPPVIDTLEAIQTKLELVEALIEIENAVEIMSHDEGQGDELLSHYRQLRSRLTPVEPGSERWKLLESYMVRGHDTLSGNWAFVPKVRHIFEIDREDENSDTRGEWMKNANRMLLWHGSRLSNWVGIISKGLRIAPPEAPSTGYRLGKGVYLANTVSKSGSYCFTDASNPTGVMLLAEAALGKQYTTLKDHYMDAPQPGTDSTYATGQFSPDPSQTEHIEGAFHGTVAVPAGAPIKTQHARSNFTHDEFVVYDVRQVKMRYVYVVDFDHNVGRKRRW